MKLPMAGQPDDETYLVGRWIKLKTSGKIWSENTTFKAFHMPAYISLALQKLAIVEFLRIRLVFIRADNICLVSLCNLTHEYFFIGILKHTKIIKKSKQKQNSLSQTMYSKEICTVRKLQNYKLNAQET